MIFTDVKDLIVMAGQSSRASSLLWTSVIESIINVEEVDVISLISKYIMLPYCVRFSIHFILELAVLINLLMNGLIRVYVLSLMAKTGRKK